MPLNPKVPGARPGLGPGCGTAEMEGRTQGRRKKAGRQSHDPVNWHDGWQSALLGRFPGLFHTQMPGDDSVTLQRMTELEGSLSITYFGHLFDSRSKNLKPPQRLLWYLPQP